jgi:hypothetical protein
MRGVASIRQLVPRICCAFEPKARLRPRFLSVERRIYPKCCRNASRSIKSFETADQNGSGLAFRPGYHVEHPVQTIDAIDVNAASGSEHHLRPRRATLGGMRGEIVNPFVSFRFHDVPSDAHSTAAAHKLLTNQIARDLCSWVLEETQRNYAAIDGALSIPSQLNDGPKDEVCRSPDQARDDVEINADLGTNHGNKKQQSDHGSFSAGGAGARKLTGTGLAYPNRNGERRSKRIAGIKIVPNETD